MGFAVFEERDRTADLGFHRIERGEVGGCQEHMAKQQRPNHNPHEYHTHRLRDPPQEEYRRMHRPEARLPIAIIKVVIHVIEVHHRPHPRIPHKQKEWSVVPNPNTVLRPDTVVV